MPKTFHVPTVVLTLALAFAAPASAQERVIGKTVDSLLDYARDNSAEYAAMRYEADAAGERIRLRKPGSPEPDGTVPYVLVEEVQYDDEAPWPVAGAMDGRSIERANTAWFSNDPAHWRAGLPGGGPGLGLSDGDSDGDGLPDEWEIDWFGDIGPPGPAGDRDGDGRPDTEQFIDGSGASNGMQAVEVCLSNAIPPVVWFGTREAQGPGYQGRVRMYAFEWTDSPATGTWTAVSGFGHVEGEGQTVLHTNSPSDPFRAYRVRAWIENRP